MEKKNFVKVAQTYAPMNKLASAIIDELKHFNQTLFESQEAATKAIWKAFEQTSRAYMITGGKAQLPDYREYDLGGGVGIHVGNIIILHVWEVKAEF